jgi:hypothetical protein
MTCIIHSITNDIPYNSWEYIKSIKKIDDSFIYHSNDIMTNHVINTGGGVFIKINDDIYVITCYHIIGKYSINIDCFFNKERLIKIPLENFKSLQEYDISVLKMDKIYYDMVEYYTESDILNINNLENIYLKNIFMKDDCICTNKILIDDIIIENDFLNSVLIPKIPLYKYNCDLLESQLEGISGNLLMIEDKIIGLTTSCNGKIEALPMIIIFNLVKQLINTNKCLEYFKFDTNIVEIKLGTIEKTSHYVNDDYNLGYKIYKKKNKFKFRKQDVILNINNININDNGKIYDEYFNYEFEIDTYMMIINYLYDYVKIELLSSIKAYEKISVNITGININNIYNINIFDNNKYLYYYGLIFTELSEEFIKKCIIHGIPINRNICDFKIGLELVTTKNIILIDVHNEINKINPELPYIKNILGYQHLILEKIGNNKIFNIDDFNIKLKICKSTHKIIFKYINDKHESQKYKLSLKNVIHKISM